MYVLDLGFSWAVFQISRNSGNLAVIIDQMFYAVEVWYYAYIDRTIERTNTLVAIKQEFLIVIMSLRIEIQNLRLRILLGFYTFIHFFIIIIFLRSSSRP